MAFREEVEVLLLTESHVVEHIKGVELEIISDKLIAHTETEFKNLHTHKLELSYERMSRILCNCLDLSLKG
ncbi:TPA: hypothetical protein KD870_004062 [Vibrio parahaemolyticus]|nr:hypothetical protein [Vibrio parahaemolyticus]